MMDLDEADTAFIDSLMPPGSIPTGLVAIVTWLNPDGSPAWQVYARSEETTAATVGLLEVAKLELLNIKPTDDEDEDADG